MYDVPVRSFYYMGMMDHDEVSLDRMIEETYGRKYQGQQTGEMISNDTHIIYEMNEFDVEEALYTDDEDEPYSDPKYGDRQYYGEAVFKMWLADDKEYKYDLEHIRQAPTPDVALAMLIKDGHLPYGTYLIHVWW